MFEQNLYAMTNAAIAEELGERIEQMRLEQNMTQESISQELGITKKTYRKLKKGQAKLELVIGALRVLNALESINNFIPKTSFSPMALLKNKAKVRLRASKSKAKQSDSSMLNGEQEW